MTNGAFITSQLPVTQNVNPTDRILVLRNATGVSGSPTTMMIPVTSFVNATISTVLSDIASSNNLTLGNSTVNVFVTSTSLTLQNLSGEVFNVDGNGVITGNGFNITSVNALAVNGLSTVAYSGNYNDLLNIPASFGIANNTSYVGNVTAANVVSNAQLQANLLAITAGAIVANSGIVSNAFGTFVNLDSSGLGFNSGGLAVVANNGIVANATGVFVNANNGLVSNASGVFVVANTGLTVNSSGLFANQGVSLPVVITQDSVNNIIITANTTNSIPLTVRGAVSGAANLLQVANSGSVLFAINSSGVAVGNGAGLTSINVVGYQTTAGLASNVATLAANNAAYLGGTIASSYALSSALGSYQTTAGLSTNVATLSANSAAYLGGTIASGYQTTAGLNANIAAYLPSSANVLPIFSSTTNGIVKLSGGGTTNYLRADGSWTAPTGGAANPSGTNTQIQFNNSGTFGAEANLIWNQTTVTMGIGTGTINATTYTGTAYTANSASYLGSILASGYQTTSGLASNVAALAANNAAYLGGVAAASYVNTSQLTNNLASYPTNTQFVANLGNYPTNTQFQANLANYPTNTQFVANLGNYQTAAGLASNVAILASNNASYLGGLAAGFYVANSGNYTLSGNINFVPATIGGIPLNIRGVSGGTANLFQVGNNITAAQFAVNSIGVAVGNGAGITSIMLANSASYLGGTIASGYQTTAGLASNVATLPANNASYLGGTIASGYQTTAGLTSNVATLAANNALYLGGVAAASYVNTFQLTNNLANYPTNTQFVANLANYPTNTQFVANLGNYPTNTQFQANLANYPTNTQFQANIGNYQTTAGLASNVATLPANNASYLGGVAAASYVNTFGNYTLSGNISFIAATTGGTPVMIRGAPGGTAPLFQVGNNTTGAQFTVNSIGVMIGNGAGLTSVTSTFVANSGIVSNASGVFVNANTGLVANSSGLFSIASGSPGGSNTYIQFNNSSSFGGEANLTWNQTTVTMGIGTGTINSTTYTGTALLSNNASYLGGTIASGYQTIAGLASNVATLPANNASYLGGVVSTSYVNTIGNYTLSGNISFIAATTGGTPVMIRGAPGGTAPLLSIGNNTTIAQFTVNSIGVASGNGAGLTSVTSTFVANSGIVSNASGVFVNANTGLIANSSGLFATAVGTGNGSVGGSNTQIQYNNSGNFGGDANLTWNHTTLTVGNGSVNVATNSTSLMVGNVGGSIIVNSATVIVGNSTVNNIINSSSIVITNSSGNIFAINSSGVLVGNGAGLTSVPGSGAITANYGIVSNATGVFVNANTGLTANSSGLFATGTASIVANSGIVSNASGVFVNANTGLTVNSSGLFATAVGTGNGSVGGTNTQIQYNNSGNFGGAAGLIYLSGTANNMTVIGQATGAVPLTIQGYAAATNNLLQVANSGSVVFAVNSSGVLVGNGAGLTSVPGTGGGSATVLSNTYSNRPGSPGIGTLFVVTDANVTSGIINVGGNNNIVMTWYNGTDWRVLLD